MMKHKGMIFTLFLTVLPCRGLMAGEGPDLSGFVRNYTAVLAKDRPEFAMIQNTAELSLEHRADKVSFKLTSWLNQYPGKDLEIGLREAFLDMYLGPFDMRIGKQQIIWGKGEGVFITDVVCPRDMREFLLPDFDEIRIGITALKTTCYLGNHNFELVLVPRFTPTKMPEKGSIWRREPEYTIQPLIDSSQADIFSDVENGEVFAKYSLMNPVADIDIMGGHMWDDDPSPHVEKVIDSVTGMLSSVTVTPRHHRVSVAGAAFSLPLADVIVRGDGAWYTGKRFVTADPGQTHGLVEKQYINYLLGIDYTVWETRLSTQFIQRIILDYDAPIAEDAFDNMTTVLLNRSFLRETLTLELFSYIGLNEPDALVRPGLLYDFADGFQIQFGANIFFGDEGRFGRFDKNDMVYLKTQFSF